MKKREDMRMVKLDFFTFYFFKLAFLGRLKKNQYIHFLVHGRFSWSTFGLHLSEESKGFVIDFSRNYTREVGP